MSDMRKITYSDIPNEILKTITEYVSDYTVCMIGYSDDDKRIIDSISTGTLISYENFIRRRWYRHTRYFPVRFPTAY